MKGILENLIYLLYLYMMIFRLYVDGQNIKYNLFATRFPLRVKIENIIQTARSIESNEAIFTHWRIQCNIPICV